MKISDTNIQVFTAFCGTFTVALMLLYAFPMAYDGNAGLLVAIYFGFIILAGLRQSATLMICAILFGFISILTYNYVNGFALVRFLGLIPVNTIMNLLVALLSAFFSILFFFLRNSQYRLLQAIGLGMLCGIVLMSGSLFFNSFYFQSNEFDDIYIHFRGTSVLAPTIASIPGGFTGLLSGLICMVLWKEPIQLSGSLKWQVLAMIVYSIPLLLFVYPELLDLDYDGLYGTKSNRLISNKIRHRLNTLYQTHKSQRNIKLPLSSLLHDISWDRFCGLQSYSGLHKLAQEIPFRDHRIAQKWDNPEAYQHFIFIINQANVIPIDMQGMKFSQMPCAQRSDLFSLNVGTWVPEGDDGGQREDVILSLENKPLENPTTPSSSGESR
jgi:hypothetical protein